MPHLKIKSKVCRDCGRRRRVESFYVKERRPHATHYFSRCADCYYAFIHGTRKKGPRRIGLHPFVRGGARENRRRESFKAWAAINNAVYKGRLKKPHSCEACGRGAAKRDLHGHHDDYKKKYDVRWLCKRCHKKAHAT